MSGWAILLHFGAFLLACSGLLKLETIAARVRERRWDAAVFWVASMLGYFACALVVWNAA